MGYVITGAVCFLLGFFWKKLWVEIKPHLPTWWPTWLGR